MRESLKTVFILASVLLLTDLSATAQENLQKLNIKQPPSGSLTKARLSKVAKDIRRVESNPYAQDNKLARAYLFKWLTGSPDITVSVCPEVIGPLLKSEGKYKGELLAQYLLSSAAYTIENPTGAANQVAVKTGGLLGALRTYSIYKDKEEKEAEDEFMERISELNKKGTLRKYVEKGVKGCQ